VVEIEIVAEPDPQPQPQPAEPPRSLFDLTSCVCTVHECEGSQFVTIWPSRTADEACARARGELMLGR